MTRDLASEREFVLSGGFQTRHLFLLYHSSPAARRLHDRKHYTTHQTQTTHTHIHTYEIAILFNLLVTRVLCVLYVYQIDPLLLTERSFLQQLGPQAVQLPLELGDALCLLPKLKLGLSIHMCI